MNARLTSYLTIKLFFLSLLLINLYGCTKQPTYPKEHVEESVKKLCKEEYGLDVGVKIIGSTLGVLIPIEGLIDKTLQLNSKAADKIEDVVLSIHRVTMSTDSPLKFYVLTARDTLNIGAEFILTGFIYDVLRVRLFDISRGEYHQRILRDFKFNMLALGEAKIRELFGLLNEDSPAIQEVKPLFYPIFTIGEPKSQRIDILQILSKEISPNESLFYVKTKEFYRPLRAFETYRAIFPPYFDNGYLILVNITLMPNPIKEIVTNYFYSGNEIRQRDLKGSFDQYDDIGYIGLDGMPKKDLELGWFLGEQIARRIKMLFIEDRKLSKKFIVTTTEGRMKDNFFKFSFSITSMEPSDNDIKIIFSRILKLAAGVLHRYSFEDFKGIELIDKIRAEKKLYLSKEELENFRKGSLKVEHLLF